MNAITVQFLGIILYHDCFCRAFQPTTGACVCNSGYIYYDEADSQQVDSDGPQDCQQIVSDKCPGNQYRDSSTRSCVDTATVDCTDPCPNGGAFNGELGRYVKFDSCIEIQFGL